jgi:hypothetical protein
MHSVHDLATSSTHTATSSLHTPYGLCSHTRAAVTRQVKILKTLGAATSHSTTRRVLRVRRGRSKWTKCNTVGSQLEGIHSYQSMSTPLATLQLYSPIWSTVLVTWGNSWPVVPSVMLYCLLSSCCESFYPWIIATASDKGNRFCLAANAGVPGVAV